MLFFTHHICLVNLHLNKPAFTDQILDLLIPEEDAEMSDLVLEVTAGVGGQEAMLFTAEVWKYLYISLIILDCSC